MLVPYKVTILCCSSFHMLLVPYVVVIVCCSSFNMILVPYKVLIVCSSSFHLMLVTYTGIKMLVPLKTIRPLVSLLGWDIS